MLLEPLTHHMLTRNKGEILHSAPEHGEIAHTDMATHNGVKLHIYTVNIPGFDGQDRWQVSLGNHVHTPNESISLVGFARNGDWTGHSSDFAISGAAFVRHALPKILAHHIKTMKESGRNVTALTLGAEGVTPVQELKKQRVYQTMFDGFGRNETPEASAASSMFKQMFGKPAEMPMSSFHVPRHFTII